MAKKSMIAKQKRTPKFKVREYTRCERCGRPHSVIRKFKFCRICFRELPIKVKFLVLKKLAGKNQYWEGGKIYGYDRSNCRFVTRIRNANMVRHENLEVPASKIKKDIARYLKREGFIRDYEFIEDNKQGIIRIFLKYGPNKERVITGLKRIS